MNAFYKYCIYTNSTFNFKFNKIIKIFYFIHDLTSCRAPDSDSGRLYSWGLNIADGSQSMVMRPRVSLYSIGHTKNRY